MSGREGLFDSLAVAISSGVDRGETPAPFPDRLVVFNASGTIDALAVFADLPPGLDGLSRV